MSQNKLPKYELNYSKEYKKDYKKLNNKQKMLVNQIIKKLADGEVL